MGTETTHVGQHPATHDAWAWLVENRASLDQEKADRIDTTLREISSEFWAWEQERRRDRVPPSSRVA